MREGWQGAGGLPEMAGGATVALDLFGRADAVAQDAVTGFPEMASSGTAFALDLFGQGDTVAQNTGGASGTAGAQQNGHGAQQNGHGAGENVAAIGAEQDGTNGLSETAGLSLAAGDIVSTASGAANGEFSQTDAANGLGAAANGLSGADATDGELAQADAGIDAAGGESPESEAAALLREMRAQYGLPEAGAAELLAAFGEDRSRGQHIREQAVRQAAFRGVMGEYLSMLREADALRARYAGFSLPELLEDTRFLGMLRAGLSMEDAYLAMHGREVLRQAIAATHRWTETQLRAQWAEESRRPLEGAMTGGSTALSRTNPAQMSRAQREAIARRVLKGERVLL